MANLTNQYISSSYSSILNIGTSPGQTITSQLQNVTDGVGDSTPLSISTNTVDITGSLTITGSILPGVTNTYDLGSSTHAFRHLYVSSGSVWLDGNQILTLANEAQDTALQAPSGGTLQLLNNIVFSSTSDSPIGGTFTMMGAGPNNQTQTNYTGSYHFINNNGYMSHINKIGGQDGTGSFTWEIVDGGEFQIDNWGGPINLNSYTGSINLLGEGVGTNINIQAPEVHISGSLFVNGNTYQSGTFYADQIDVSRGNIVENTGSYVATFNNDGILEYATYEQVAIVLGQYSSSGTAGTSGTSGTSGQSGSSGSSGSSGTSPIVTNFITTGSIGQTQTITGSLQINSGSFIMIGTTGSNTAIVFPFIVGNDVQTPSKIYQNSNGSLALSPNNTVVIENNGQLYIPGNGVPSINLGQDDYGNNTNMTYGGITQFVSGSAMQSGGGFVQDFISDTDSGQVLGFAISSYNTPDGSLSANFFGPGSGNNIIGGNADNTVFQIPITGSTLTIFRNTIVSGTTATSNGFVMAQLPGTQTIPNGEDTIVEFTAEIDTNDWWNSGAHQFEPNVAGYYEVTAFVNWAPNLTTTLQQNIQIRKNDSGLTITQNPITSLDNLTQTTSTIVYLDGNTDYVNLSAYTSATSGQVINGGNGTYITIKLL